MQQIRWKLRVRLFLQRFWQPSCACMTCMPGSLGALSNPSHWVQALQTGLLTGTLAVLVTFTPALRLFDRRSGNALMMGVLTMIGDFWVHLHHDDLRVGEVLRTGVVSGLLAWAGTYLLEVGARRLRIVWAALVRRRGDG